MYSEERFLVALDKVLSSRFTKYDYNIGSYQECATCIEKDGDAWLVYDGERYNHNHEVRCELLPVACWEMLKKMTVDREMIKEMHVELYKYLTELV